MRKSIKHICLIVLILLSYQGYVKADTHAPASAYKKIAGENLVFVMSADHENDPVYSYKEEIFPGSGLYKVDDASNPIWTVQFYCYDGQVLFIDNYEYMIVREFDYSTNNLEQTAFSIYRKGEIQKTFKVSEFIKEPGSFYQSSASHYSWGGKYRVDGNILIISTEEGKEYSVNALTGKVMKSRRLTPKIETSNIIAIIFGGIFVLCIAGLLIYLKKR